MKRFLQTSLLLAIVLAGPGCTTMSLQSHTVNQSRSATAYRYQAALHSLAMVAADPATLPSYALLSGGTTSISDTGMIMPTSEWSGMGGPEIFRTQTLAL